MTMRIFTVMLLQQYLDEGPIVADLIQTVVKEPHIFSHVARCYQKKITLLFIGKSYKCQTVTFPWMGTPYIHTDCLKLFWELKSTCGYKQSPKFSQHLSIQNGVTKISSPYVIFRNVLVNFWNLIPSESRCAYADAFIWPRA